MSIVEHPSSKAVASAAANSGVSTGTRYSSRKSATVGSQLDALTRPALRKTLATLRRKSSW
jgi:hypothetical protein